MACCGGGVDPFVASCGVFPFVLFSLCLKDKSLCPFSPIRELPDRLLMGEGPNVRPSPTPTDPFFGQRYIHILGRQKLYHVVKYTGGSAELLFFVEGLRFPDDSFSGLVSIHVSLLEYMAEVRATGLPWAAVYVSGSDLGTLMGQVGVKMGAAKA